jgi:hypothetical protein
MARTPSKSKIVDALLEHMYSSPAREWLDKYSPEWFYIVAVSFSPVEVMKMESNEEEFVTFLTARIRDTLWEINEKLWAPTLPVHDEPMPKELYSNLVP